MSARQTIVWIGIAICLGCIPNPDPPAATAPAAPAVSTAPVAEAPPPAEAVGVATPPQTEPASQPAALSSSTPPTDPASGIPPQAETPADTERVAAKAGVGKQGQSLKEHSGVIVEAAKAYFNVRQRAVFEIQIPEALKLYEATEGRKPKSHDEFMAKVIAANSINLPNLPQGDKYVYDPDRGELMVEKRAK